MSSPDQTRVAQTRPHRGANPHSAPVMQRPLPTDRLLARVASLTDWLRDPFLLLLTGFLAVMVALSMPNDTIHNLAMKIRWPVLATMAAGGLALAANRGMGKWSPAHWTMAIFIVVSTASSLYSRDPEYSFLRAFSVILLFAATGIGVYAYCRTLRDTLKMTDLLFFFGAALVIGGFLYTRGRMGLGGRYEGLHSRATGTGTYGAIFLPLAIYQVRYRLRGTMKTFGWGVIALLFLQITLAGARMAIVTAAGTCLLIWFDFYGRKTMFALIALAMVAPVPFILNIRNVEKLQDNTKMIVRTESLGDFTGRLPRWLYAIEQFQKRPIAGHGFGVSRMVAGWDDPRRFELQPGDVFNLHSDQFEALMDTGILGYPWFACFWLALIWAGWKAYKRPVSIARQLEIAYLGTIVYTFGDTFMHGGFLAAGGGVSSFTWTMLFIFLAVQTNLAEKVPARKRGSPRRRPNVAAANRESSSRADFGTNLKADLRPVFPQEERSRHEQPQTSPPTIPLEPVEQHRPLPRVRDIVGSPSRG